MKNSLRFSLGGTIRYLPYILAPYHRRCPRKARSIPCAALTPRLRIRHRKKNSIQENDPARKSRSRALFSSSLR